MSANQELQVIFTLNNKAFNKDLTKTQKSIGSFNESIKGIASNLAAAFGTRELIKFGIESSKLAGKVDGVKMAFDKLGSVDLQSLRQATSGTVTDLELMQKTNIASKLGLDVSKLAGLFQFAAKTAQETGQSVDYLVGSIVTGIGRKSPLILDNLGISAIQLKEALNGVAMESASVAQITEAVEKIALKSMGSMSGLAETTEIKTDRLSASWQRLSNSFGQKSQGSYNKVLDFLTLAIDKVERLYKSTSDIINETASNTSAGLVGSILGSSASDADKIIQFENAIQKYKFLVDEAEKTFASASSKVDKWDRLNPFDTEDEKAFNKAQEEYSKLNNTLTLLNKAKKEFKGTGEAVNAISENEQKVLEKLAQQLTINASAYGINTNQVGLLEGNVSALETALIALRSLGVSPLNEEYKALNDTLETSRSLLSSQNVAPLNPTLNAPQKLGTGLPTKPENLEGVKTFNNELANTDNILKQIGFTWENVGMQFTQGFTNILESGSFTFKSLIVDLTRMIGKMVAALAIQTALASLFDPSAAGRTMSTMAAVGLAAGGLALGGIPQLAEGGIATSPTLAMIGEGRESEAVLPLSKLDNMMNNGGGGGYIADVRLSGQDFLIGLRRAEQFRGRTSS
jgi:hypothetical protein